MRKLLSVIYVLIALQFVSIKTFAQYVIQGRILDNTTSEEISGAKVQVLTTSKYTFSDFIGKFEITKIANEICELEISYQGYQTKKVSILLKKDIINLVEVKLIKNVQQLKEVVISSKHIHSETDLFTRKLEMNAPNVLNSISYKSIQISPDITVANVLQRISAVSIERNSSGDGQYAIIRGMDKRYNYTLVNGIKIPSPDNKNRYIPMDVFPSDLLERLEVIKALTPSMEGDAIGGAMNMILKTAPDSLMISAQLGIGYSMLFTNRSFVSIPSSVLQDEHYLKDPRERNGSNYQAITSDFIRTPLHYNLNQAPVNSQFGFSLGERFYKNKIGFIIGISNQNSSRGANSVILLPSSQPYNAASRNDNMILHFEDINYREYSNRQSRIGTHLKMDYSINRKHQLSLYAMMMKLDEVQTRFTIDTNTKAQRSGPGTGEIHLYDRSKYNEQWITSATIQGKHAIFNDLQFQWTLALSKATSNTPGWYDFERIYGVSLDSSGKQQALPQQVGKLNMRWMHNSDIDKAIYAQLNYSNDDFILPIELNIGTMYRIKSRYNYYNSYELSPTADAQGNYPQYYSNIDNALFALLGLNAGLGSPKDPNNYSIDEQVYAYFLQFKFLITSRLQLFGGVRTESTKQNYVSAADINQLVGASGQKMYTDILPSLHAKYTFNKKSNIRASYFASICRPGFFEIIPYALPGENYTEVGNYKLKHTTADNYDLRYEYYPRSIDQILVGLFYKSIYNPIEYGFYREPGNPTGLYLSPQNFGNATNYGVECSVIKHFGNFGFNLNYTYTSSQIKTSKAIYYRDLNGNLTTDSISQTRPLQGQSAHIANFSILYKNHKQGINSQISIVYTGRRIAQISAYYNLDIWQRDFYQVDFSFEKRIKQGFYFYFKINNILNTPYITEIVQPNIYRSGVLQLPVQDASNSVTTQRDIYYQTWLIGLRYRLN